jgi:hypothetical protein
MAVSDGEDILAQELRGYILNEGLVKALKGAALITLGAVGSVAVATKEPKVALLSYIVGAVVVSFGLKGAAGGIELIKNVSW